MSKRTDLLLTVAKILLKVVTNQMDLVSYTEVSNLSNLIDDVEYEQEVKNE